MNTQTQTQKNSTTCPLCKEILRYDEESLESGVMINHLWWKHNID